MALFKCGECGNNVSDKAASCPSCGCPISSSPNTGLSLNEFVSLVSRAGTMNKHILDFIKVGDNISPKKAAIALNVCKVPNNQALYAIIDLTIMGSIEDAICFTNIGIYYKSSKYGINSKSNINHIHIPYSELNNYTFKMDSGRPWIYMLVNGESVYELFVKDNYASMVLLFDKLKEHCKPKDITYSTDAYNAGKYQVTSDTNIVISDDIVGLSNNANYDIDKNINISIDFIVGTVIGALFFCIFFFLNGPLQSLVLLVLCGAIGLYMQYLKRYKAKSPAIAGYLFGILAPVIYIFFPR